MIISHKHKFIFIKTNKTAGTSLEIALSKFCGTEDIITSVIASDEEIREKLGYRGPQNFYVPYKYYKIYDYLNLLFRLKRKKYFHHMTASEIKESIEPYIWENYYKFTIERNPYDRVVSFYYWKHQYEPRPTLLEHLMSENIMNLKRWGYNGYTINDKIVVDKIIKYENIEQELSDLKNILELDEDIVMPKTKHNFRKKKANKYELIGPKERIIDKLFDKEFKLFGYTNEL